MIQLFQHEEFKGTPLKAGTWTYATRDGKQTAKISCPNCSKSATLDPEDHQISRHDGSVNPSVICDCGYHEWIALEGYCGTPE